MSEIAQKDGTTIIRLERLNRLSPASPLLAGSELSLPAPSVPELRYVVSPGDTLSGIAARFGTTPAAIAAASGIDAVGPILTGTTLRVPALARGRIEPAAASVPELRYVVSPGDTLSGIAARFGTTPAAIAAASGIDAVGPILTGTTLRVPALVRPAVEPAAASVPELRYVVSPGDTLSGIAARFGTTPAAIAAASGIDAAGPILTGTTLRVPSRAPGGIEPAAASVPELRYVVSPGDTLSGIAARFGTTPAAIAAASGIDAAGPILVGATLRVPQVSDGGSSSAESSYEVRAGDTLDGIAARYGLSLGVLADLNHLDVNAPLLVGTRLALPAGAGSGGASAADAASVRASLVLWADHYGVSEQLVTALAWMESGFNNELVSSAGAVGVMQVTPDTWDYVEQVLLLGQSVPDTSDGNVRIGVAYLHHLLHIYDGDPYRALAAYYQGARSLLLYGFLPGTAQYVDDILALAQRF